MGILATSRLEAGAAFTTAATVTETGMRKRVHQFRLFAGRQVIHATGGDLWPQGVVHSNDTCIDGVLLSTHRASSRLVAQSRNDNLIASLDVGTERGSWGIAHGNGSVPCCFNMARQCPVVNNLSTNRCGLYRIAAASHGPHTCTRQHTWVACERYIEPGGIANTMACTSLQGVMTLGKRCLAPCCKLSRGCLICGAYDPRATRSASDRCGKSSKFTREHPLCYA